MRKYLIKNEKDLNNNNDKINLPKDYPQPKEFPCIAIIAYAGEGWDEIDYIYKKDFSMIKKIPCPHCHGTGETFEDMYGNVEFYKIKDGIKQFIKTEFEELAGELIAIDQNILLSVQNKKISTGRALELLRQNVIDAFKKRGINIE